MLTKITAIIYENRARLTDVLFHTALMIELVLMIVEKSEITFGGESYVFRVTFLITLAAVLLMKHDRREWAVIAAAWLFTGVCYMVSGRNDLLRIVTFMMAARDIDLEKTMKYILAVCSAGFLLIAILSLTGIMGDVYLVADYGRQEELELRYTLGFGHPNTLFSSAYALILMWLWIYGKKGTVLQYILLAAFAAFIAHITASRTGVAVLELTIVLAAIIRIFDKLKNHGLAYVLSGMISPVSCVVVSVVAAIWSGLVYMDPGNWHDDRFWGLEARINYRMSSLYYTAENHGALFINWKPFAGHNTEYYFDMGWVRLFYWYGFIPAAVIIALLIFIIYLCRRKKDLWTPLLIVSLGVYTIIEAAFVSRYIGRSFFLPIFGVYLGSALKNKKL